MVNSNQLEDEESFDMSLFRNGLTNNIRIGSRRIATITIQDDDSKFDDNYSIEKSSCFTHFYIEYYA